MSSAPNSPPPSSPESTRSSSEDSRPSSPESTRSSVDSTPSTPDSTASSPGMFFSKYIPSFSSNAENEAPDSPEMSEEMRAKIEAAEEKWKQWSPASSRRSTQRKKKPSYNKAEKKEESTSESDTDDTEATFENYSVLCERVAKTMYYANARQRCTPRPSLPLTILAVDTFSKHARKDTLEFLDIDMAAEIGRNACVSPTALVFALVYLERLSANNPGYLKTIKPSELFVVSLLVASKFVQDDGEDLGIFNDEWAASANMDLKRINKLELEFLTAIDWKVNVGNGEYDRAFNQIEEKMALYQGSQRGWFTYTELTSLSNSLMAWDAVIPVMYERLAEIVTAVSVMYTTFFATLISSSVLAPYLLSLSKLILISSGANSLLASSPLSSCLQDLSLENASMTVPSSTYGTIPSSNIQLYKTTARSGSVLASLEDQENATVEDSVTNTQAWKQQLSIVLSRHRRFYESSNENYGYSFKCDHNCNKYSPEEPIANVQRVLENVLHSSNILNYKNAPINDILFGNDLKLCIKNGVCFKPPPSPAAAVPRNFLGSKMIKV